MNLVRGWRVVLLLPTLLACGREVPQSADPRVRLEHQLVELREELRIPGMSAAIARDGEVVWARGFGWADQQRKVPATPDTVYHLASLTKPYAATVVLQLVEEGRLSLDVPIQQLGVSSRHPRITVRHLLSHTSGGQTPGSEFRYDGGAFAELEEVIERVTGRTFAEELTDRIIRPLQLRHTAPNPDDERKAITRTAIDPGPIRALQASEYARRYGRGVWPTGLFGPNDLIDYPTSFHPAAGLVASAADVARFAAALDKGELLDRKTQELATTRSRTSDGTAAPYGLGWFVQHHRGVKLVWHYGHWFGSSSLMVRVPDQRLTFVVLANSEGLSRRTGLGDHADVFRSRAARLFIETFVDQQTQ